MAFSRRHFLADRSNSNKSPVHPSKTYSPANFHRQQQDANASRTPSNQSGEQKENRGSQKGRFWFPPSPPTAAGKSYLSPKRVKEMPSAVRSPLVTFSPKKILGQKANFHPKNEQLADGDAILKENRLRLSGDSIITRKGVGGAQKKASEEVCGAEPLAFQHASSAKEFVQNSQLQQQFADASYGKIRLRPVASTKEGEDTFAVTQDCSVNIPSIERVGPLREDHGTECLKHYHKISDNEGSTLPKSFQHVIDELKSKDDPTPSRCAPELIESGASAINAVGSTIQPRNVLSPSETLEGSETEASSKRLAAKKEDGDTTLDGDGEVVFKALFEANEKLQLEVSDHSQSTAKLRFLYVLGLLSFAVVFFLTCRNPQFLSSFVHQSLLPRMWENNSYGEQLNVLLQGTRGLWTPAYSHYLQSPDPHLQLNLKKNLQSAEISSSIGSILKYLRKETIRHLDVESSPKGMVELWRYMISAICKVNKSICSQTLQRELQKLLGNWKHQLLMNLPSVGSTKAIARFRRWLAEYMKAQILLHCMEPITTPLNKMYKFLKFSLLSKISWLENVCGTLSKYVDRISLDQILEASIKLWKSVWVDLLSSAMNCFHSDCLLLSKYKALLHSVVETINARKLALIDAFTRKPAFDNDLLLPDIEEWDWLSVYDMPSDEVEGNEMPMAGYTDLPQLDSLLSVILYGESEEIKARYLDLLQVADANLYATEHAQLPSNVLVEGKDSASDENTQRENDKCQTETWKEEFLSVCEISDKSGVEKFDLAKDAPICEDCYLTDNGSDNMLYGMVDTENDDSELNPGEAVESLAPNGPQILDVSGADHGVGISSTDSAIMGESFFAEHSKTQSLGSTRKIATGTLYVLTTLACFAGVYCIYSQCKKLPKAKTHYSFCHNNSEEKRSESPKRKEVEVQSQIPKKRIWSSSGVGGLSTIECLKPKSLEEASVRSPDSCATSPSFGSFTKYKRVIVSEQQGQEQEKVVLTPVRRSSRIQKYQTSST